MFLLKLLVLTEILDQLIKLQGMISQAQTLTREKVGGKNDTEIAIDDTLYELPEHGEQHWDLGMD